MSKNINVPKLRFKEFKGKWKEKKYGDIYSFYVTNSFSRDNLNYIDGVVKNIHYGDIHTKFSTLFNIVNEDTPFINSNVELSNIKDECYCLVGDLIVADASEDYADIGKTMEITNLNNEKTLAGLHTFLARPDKYDMALGYSGYMLQSWKIRWQVMRESQGTKVLSLSTKRLSNIHLIIPQQQEQQKIASFLIKVDNLIKLLSQKEVSLGKYKKSMLQQIFSQEIRFKNDNEVDFNDWKVKKLSEICTINKGNQLNKDLLTIDDIYPAINGGINPSGYTNKWNKLANTITISEGGNSCGYINLIKTNFWAGGHCYSIDNFNVNTKTNYKYLYQYLKYNELRVMRLRVGSGLPNIQKGEIANFKINLPQLEEQIKIANFLSLIDNQIEQSSKQLEKVKEFKKSLLQQMFI